MHAADLRNAGLVDLGAHLAAWCACPSMKLTE